MAKAKGNPLIEQLDQLPADTNPLRGGLRWDGRMARDYPEEFANLREIGLDFVNGGQSYQKLRCISRLFEWLKKIDAIKVKIEYSQFRLWINSLKDEK